MTEQPNNSEHLYCTKYECEGGQVQLPNEMEMILAYRHKVQLIKQQQYELGNKKAVASESLAVVLDKAKIRKIMEQPGFDSLVAFFGAVPESDAPATTFKNTLVLMGLDEHGNLLPHDLDHGMFTVAQQTWSFLMDLDNEEEFQEFFRVSYK